MSYTSSLVSQLSADEEMLVEVVGRRPDMTQNELSAALMSRTGCAASRAKTFIRDAEANGLLVSSRINRKKAYDLSQAMKLEIARRAEAQRLADAQAIANGRANKAKSKVLAVSTTYERDLAAYRSCLAATRHSEQTLNPLLRRWRSRGAASEAELTARYERTLDLRSTSIEKMSSIVAEYDELISNAGDGVAVHGVSTVALAAPERPQLDDAQAAPSPERVAAAKDEAVPPPAPAALVAAGAALGTTAIVAVFIITAAITLVVAPLLFGVQLLGSILIAVVITVLSALGVWKFFRLRYWIARLGGLVIYSPLRIFSVAGVVTVLIALLIGHSIYKPLRLTSLEGGARASAKSGDMRAARTALTTMREIDSESSQFLVATDYVNDAAEQDRRERAYADGRDYARDDDYVAAAEAMDDAAGHRDSDTKADEYWYEAALAFHKSGESRDAAHAMSKAGNHQDATELAASYWYEEGSAAAKTSDFARAAKAYENAGDLKDAAKRATYFYERVDMDGALKSASALAKSGNLLGAASMVQSRSDEISATNSWTKPYDARLRRQIEVTVDRALARDRYNSATSYLSKVTANLSSGPVFAYASRRADGVFAKQTAYVKRTGEQAAALAKSNDFAGARRLIKTARSGVSRPAVFANLDARVDKMEQRYDAAQEQARIDADIAAANAAAEAASADIDSSMDGSAGNWCGASRDGDGDGIWCEGR